MSLHKLSQGSFRTCAGSVYQPESQTQPQAVVFETLPCSPQSRLQPVAAPAHMRSMETYSEQDTHSRCTKGAKGRLRRLTRGGHSALTPLSVHGVLLISLTRVAAAPAMQRSVRMHVDAGIMQTASQKRTAKVQQQSSTF